MVPIENVCILNFIIPKMKISTIKYHFTIFIFHFTIKNVLIDRLIPSNMPVDMSIVPHPHVPRARGTMDYCRIFK